jgi:hypothetical protein
MAGCEEDDFTQINFEEREEKNEIFIYHSNFFI